MKIIKQIQKIKRWKFSINDFDVAVLVESGLVTRVITSKKLTKLIKGWNIFSVIRFLYEKSLSLEVYRFNKGKFIKMNSKQLYKIIVKGTMQ